MTQSRLLKSARQLFERTEQRHAVALAESERQVRENELKLAELERYRATYMDDFEQRVSQGLSAAQVRIHQGFIARIAQAVSEQRELLARARSHHAEELRKWRAAARRSAAVNRIVDRQEQAAQQRAAKSEQAESDAHAQRLWATKGGRHGH